MKAQEIPPFSAGINDLTKHIRLLESATDAFPDHISLYIPPERDIPEVIHYLKGRIGITYPGAHSGTQARIRDSLYILISQLRPYTRTPARGLAGFCRGERRERTGSNDNAYCTVFEPPEPVKNYLFRSSTIFELEPLRQMLAGERYGLILLDRREAHWGFLRNGQIEYAGSLTSDVPGKHHKGGQSAARFQRLRVNAIEEFYRKVGEHAGNSFNARVSPENVRGIFIGGPDPTREEFARGLYLPHAIQEKILGTYDITPVDKENLSLLAVRTGEMIREADAAVAKNATDEFLRHLNKETGLAVYGKDAVRKNLKNGVVRTLLISRSLQRSKATITCQECGHTGERTFRLEPGDSVDTILATICRVCATPILEDEDVDGIEELLHLANLAAAKTVIIPENAGEESEVISGYGGIAAILRYPAEI